MCMYSFVSHFFARDVSVLMHGAVVRCHFVVYFIGWADWIVSSMGLLHSGAAVSIRAPAFWGTCAHISVGCVHT